MTGRTVLVTGGASGIGKATAELFAAAGDFVAICDVDRPAGEALVQSLGADNAMFCELDVSKEAAVAEAIGAIRCRRGSIDVVFNNAGVADARPSVLDIDGAQFRRVHEVIVLGAMLVTKYAVPAMTGKGGAIINTTSVTALRVSGGSAVYAAAKAGLRNYMQYAAVELGALGIRVNSVCPGGVNTPLLRESMGAGGDTIGADIVAAGLCSTQVIQSATQPRDIAEAVFFLASDAARATTGHDLVVDGGYVAANKGRA